MSSCGDCIVAAIYLRLGPSEFGRTLTFEMSATSCTLLINSGGLFQWAMSCWRPVPELGSCHTCKRHEVANAGSGFLLSVLSVHFS